MVKNVGLGRLGYLNILVDLIIIKESLVARGLPSSITFVYRLYLACEPHMTHSRSETFGTGRSYPSFIEVRILLLVVSVYFTDFIRFIVLKN